MSLRETSHTLRNRWLGKPAGEIVWEYEYPRDDAPHMFFRANKYPEDHPAVIGLMNQ